MVFKKKKRRRPGKTGIRRVLLFLCFLLFFGIVITGVCFYRSGSTGSTPSPLYEEIYTGPSELYNTIQQIDHSVYEALYQNGIGLEDIFFTSVIPMFGKGYEWEFTEVLVKLSNEDAAIQLQKGINRELTKLGPAVNIHHEDFSAGEYVFQVYTLGLYTHRIRLLKKAPRVPAHRGLPSIAIIIDDMGYDRKLASSLMDCDLPLCFSFLPFAPFSDSIICEAKKRGREILLHLPMEPKGYPRLDPGPGALLVKMGKEEIEERIEELIKKTPGLSGVNHHMGSDFTERYDKMEIVLRELKKRNLFYVDSRTTSRSVAYLVAKKIGVPVVKKNVFLDNDLSPKAIRSQMERLLGIARYSGAAVGIGHPHRQTLRILREYLDQLKSQYNVVPVSELVN